MFLHDLVLSVQKLPNLSRRMVGRVRSRMAFSPRLELENEQKHHGLSREYQYECAGWTALCLSKMALVLIYPCRRSPRTRPRLSHDHLLQPRNSRYTGLDLTFP